MSDARTKLINEWLGMRFKFAVSISEYKECPRYRCIALLLGVCYAKIPIYGLVAVYVL